MMALLLQDFDLTLQLEVGQRSPQGDGTAGMLGPVERVPVPGPHYLALPCDDMARLQQEKVLVLCVAWALMGRPPQTW
jgi:hypothetical protein